MIIGTVLCVTIYIYYFFIYTPLNNNVLQKSTQLTEKMATLEWMNKVKQQTHLNQAKQKVDNGQLLTLLATELKDNPNLNFPYQLQQTGSGEVQLTFDVVAFKLFIEWLEKINEHYAISVKQLDVEHSKTPGLTKLMIIITAG